MKKGYCFLFCVLLVLAELSIKAGWLPPLRIGSGMAVCKVVLSAMALAAGMVLPWTKVKDN